MNIRERKEPTASPKLHASQSTLPNNVLKHCEYEKAFLSLVLPPLS